MAIIGASANLVPADKKLYALRDVTATVDNYSLIAASIMSKKIAGGADAIVIDAKVGDGAFMKSIDDARALAEAMLDLGARSGREVVCLLTDMDQPLGRAVGNALEIREAIATVKGEGPPDFLELVLAATSRLLAVSDLGIDEQEGRIRAMQAIADGSAFEAYERWIRAQGGDPSEDALAAAPVVQQLAAPRSGYVSELGAVDVGQAALHLGAGRRTKDDTIDHAVGIVLHRKRGDRVAEGEALAEIHAATDDGRRRSGARAARRVHDRRRPAARAAGDPRRPDLARPALRWRRARAARGRDRSPPARARARRPQLRPGRDPRSAPDAPGGPARGGRGARRRAGRGRRPPRQVPGDPLRVRPGAAGSPAHDGEPAARGRSSEGRSPPAREWSSSTTAPTLVYRDVRRFGTWLLAEPGEADPYLRGPARA